MSAATAFHWSLAEWIWFGIILTAAVLWLGGIGVVLHAMFHAARELIRGPEFLRDEYPSRDLPRLPADERECE